MPIRCKFLVQAIERRRHWVSSRVMGEVYNILLIPVAADNTAENAAFFAATPTGELKLGTVKPEIALHFELGKSYYLDFTPVEPKV